MFNKTLILLSAFLMLGGCSATRTDAHEALHLRVLSYNIKHCRGEDNTFNYQRLADVIKSTEPDLVALQEIDVNTGRSSGVDQAAKLGELTGMHHYFARAIPFDGGAYGEALLSRRPFQQTSNQNLPAEPGQERRAVAWGVFAPEGENKPGYWFLGTHLCHQSAETRLKQCQAIQGGAELSYLSFPNHPIILAGDFNFTPDSDEYRYMIDAGWVDTAAAHGDPKPTYPSKNPRMRIDYVFVRPADRWRVIDVQVLDEPVASDHAPVLVVLERIQR